MPCDRARNSCSRYSIVIRYKMPRSTGTAIMRGIVFFAVLGGLILSEGVPVTENPDDSPGSTPSAATTTTSTTTRSTTRAAATAPSTSLTTEQMAEGHPMDDLLPGSSSTTSQPSTESAPTSLGFADVPGHAETTLGASVLLACRTIEPVVECQWSWRPLPPTSLPLPNIGDDSDESPDAADATGASGATTTTTTTTGTRTTGTTPAPATGQALAVRSFPAFGNTSSDCSVRFSSVKHEQTGYWSCAARRAGDAGFTSTGPARLSIVQLDRAAQVRFERQSLGSLESPVGSAVRLPCRARGRVHECQWSWRPLNQSRPFDAEMRRFPPSDGQDAPAADCELGLPAVHAEHEGFWTCGARLRASSPFVQAQPIRLLISEVEFVQLSRGIQITAGETVFLRCLLNKPVRQCEWSWKPSNSSSNSTLLRQFEPAKDNERDCSVRFRTVYEEEGLWTCGVRLTAGGILHEAPPTTVALLPSGRVNFTETPESTSVLLGGEATLRCATNGRVERCAWSWRPLAGGPEAEAKLLREFPSHGELGRNCSLGLAGVGLAEQGYWACQVHGPGGPVAAPAPAKLTVYEEGEVRFSELSQDFQVTSGATVSLRCVTTVRVEMCRWSLTSQVSANTTVVVKQFEPAGPEARDCSVKLSHALQEQEGLWTCGARLHARQNYTDAPPARLSLIEPVAKELPADCHLRSIKPSIESTLVADSPSEKSR